MTDAVTQLEGRLAKATDLRERIDLRNDLAWELRDIDPNRSHDLSESAFLLAESDPGGTPAQNRGKATCLRGLAHSNRRLGNLSLSQSQSFQSLSLLEGAPLPAVEADILRNIAIILGSLGNHSEGLEHGLKALKLVQSIGDREREADILGSIGVIYLHSRNLDESLRNFQQALQLNRALGRTRDEGLTLNNESLVHRERGDYPTALSTSLEALGLADATGFSALQVTATGTVGECYLAMGEYDQARRCFEQYSSLAHSAGSKRDEIYALILLGETDLRTQRPTSASSYLSRALELARQVGLRVEEARCNELLAEMHEQQGDLKQSLAHLRSFYALKETIFSKNASDRIAFLQVMHQVETTKREAEIQYLKTIELEKEIGERRKAEEEKGRLIEQLQEALGQVKTLSGFLPICASCKKIRDDQGYWNQIEAYLTEHSDVEFSHGLCPDCTRRLYPDLQMRED